MKPKDIDEKGRFSKGDTPWNKGNPWSEEVKLKLRQNHADMSDEKNPFYSKRHSEEAKERIRQSMIGNQHAKGYSHTPDQNERNRQAHLGKTSWCKGLKGVVNPPVGYDFQWHHVSPNQPYVVPCPTNIHNMFGGRNHYQNVNALLGIVRVAG